MSQQVIVAIFRLETGIIMDNSMSSDLMPIKLVSRANAEFIHNMCHDGTKASTLLVK